MILSSMNADRCLPWKIGAFAPAQLGDTIMATPLYQVLRRHFPAARLTLISEIIPHPALEGFNIFDEIIPYSPDLDISNQYDLFVHPVYCGGQQIDRHLDRYNFTISLNRLLAKKRTGLRNQLDGTYSNLLFYKHQMELNEDLARLIGDKEPMPAVYCVKGDPSIYEKWKGYVGFFVGDVREGQEWPAEHWKKLADLFRDTAVLFIGAPHDRRNVCEIAGQCGVPFEITSTLKDYTALCENLKLLVVEDGGAMHMASTTGVDIIALFGKSSPVLLHPWIRSSGRCIAVSSPNLCSPCDRSWSWRAAQEGLKPITCMQNISPENVAGAVHKIGSLVPGSVMIQKGNILKTKEEYLRDIPRQAGWLWANYGAYLNLRFAGRKGSGI